MLTMHEMSKLYLFQESLPESKEKELLDKLLFEYTQYIQCGTVEECQSRKEWMSYSIDDIRAHFNMIIKGLRDEVNNIRNEQIVPKNLVVLERIRGITKC